MHSNTRILRAEQLKRLKQLNYKDVNETPNNSKNLCKFLIVNNLILLKLKYVSEFHVVFNNRRNIQTQKH